MTDFHAVTADTSNTLQTNSIVFFDGVCGLCNQTVNFLLARDRQRRLKFAPLQGPTAEQLVPADVRTNLNTFVFYHQNRLYYRTTALSRILWRLGGFWKTAGALLWLIPWPLRDVGYRIVSKVRYRLFGKHETCRLPTPEERAQFLD
ncbi:MAG: DCC1-like thiol-disulfide oxidoreductase family protein [Planctomycetaceae bacterium]